MSFEKYIVYVYSVLVVVFFVYILLPVSQFPQPPADAIQSNEPADTENPLRRAYFTNYTRQEVLEHYQNEFKRPKTYFVLPTYRLNYPPEDAQTIIRDQTRSTFLEEIVVPFRESLFVNGFEPTDSKDEIFIEEQNWRQKIIVLHVPGNKFASLFIYSGVFLIIPALYVSWKSTLRDLGKIRDIR